MFDDDRSANVTSPYLTRTAVFLGSTIITSLFKSLTRSVLSLKSTYRRDQCFYNVRSFSNLRNTR